MKYIKIELRADDLPNNDEKSITKFVDKSRFIDLKMPERPILEDIDTTQTLKVGKFINDRGDQYSGEMMQLFDQQTGNNKLMRHGKGHVRWGDGDYCFGDFRNG